MTMKMMTGMQNEDWGDLSLLQHQEVGAAVAVAATPSREKFSLHETAEREEAAAASSLDDYLHNYPSVSDFVLSIPSREAPSDNEQKNEEESCDGSIMSDITEMTYRAELMKQAFKIEFEKFRQQHVQAHPKDIASMFARTMSCPDVQANMNSFVNTKSAKIKAEKRRSELVDEVADEDDSVGDPTMQRRVDELFVEFGVRPSRSYSHDHLDLLDENISRARPSNEQDVVPDHHLDSIIQLKLQLAEKQAAYDELSSKYVAMMLQKSGQQKLLAENSSLRLENERLRAQLDQAAALKPIKFGGNDATSPLIFSDSSNSFSSIMQKWRNKAA